MQQIITDLEKILLEYTPLLIELTETDFKIKKSADNWCNKEILGHLVDSAQNNIRRFVMVQYESNPHIVYNQNSWVKAASYQNYNTEDLIELWILLNRHICILLKNIPASVEMNECLTDSLHPIKWIAADYNKHLLHHLHQILNLQPVPYP